MSRYTKNDIIRMVEDEDVEFIRLQFVNIYGELKNMAVTTSQLDKVLDNRCMFNGAAIEGFSDYSKSELFLVPDLDTFEIFPWRPQQGKVARFICDVVNSDGTPFEGDSRYVLKQVLEEAHNMGYLFEVGPECEFYLFDTEEDGTPTTQTSEQGGYFDIGPIDAGENVRREIVLFLEDMGFEIESSYHAAEPAQHEVDFKYGRGIQTADNIITFKLVVRSVAKRHGLHATFMPKPRYNLRGSGLHLTMALKKDGKNIFADDNNKVSTEAYAFMAGIIEHIEGMSLINNPIVNSYKRLVPGYNAPIKVTNQASSPEALFHMTSLGGGGNRLEFRSPDASSNPYLVLAVCLAAGLDGIKRGLVPIAGIEEGMEAPKTLPATLKEAITAFEKDEFVQNVIGKHIAEKYIETKSKEWKEYCKQVSAWEVEQYLYRF